MLQITITVTLESHTAGTTCRELHSWMGSKAGIKLCLHSASYTGMGIGIGMSYK